MFPTSSSGSGSKRATVTTYDPIMEVSFQMDEEGDDETDLLVRVIALNFLEIRITKNCLYCR